MSWLHSKALQEDHLDVAVVRTFAELGRPGWGGRRRPVSLTELTAALDCPEARVSNAMRVAVIHGIAAREAPGRDEWVATDRARWFV